MKLGNHARLTAVAAVLFVSMLASCCNAQGVSVMYQNQYQCWPGVDIAGSAMPVNSRVPATSPDDCARKCASTPGCTLFTLTRSLWCNLKFLPFDSLYGSTTRDSTVMTSCILKTVGGSLPSPANTMCYSGQDVAGNLIANTASVTSSIACASLCVAVPGCSYSVFRAGGINASGVPTCSLKSNAFAGTEPASVTRRDPLVTGICFRAIPAPQIQDPLLVVAGPVPFIISTQLTNKCLRPPSSPYYPGQPLVFSSDCCGAEPLWTYNAGTQIITHWASGLCLASAGVFSGASVVLSTDCGPTSGNQVVSRGSSSLLVLLGNRWLLPANAVASEGAPMVAVCNGLQPYNYIPVPGQAYECFSRVNIAGSEITVVPNIADSNTCAALCVSNPQCTFYVYETNRNCHLRYNPFTNGITTQSSGVCSACISRGIPSGTAPSPSNYVCYANQRISGKVLNVASCENPKKCSDRCALTPGCTYSLYTFDGMCTIGNNAFYGDNGGDNSQNVADYNVIQLCLFADGAPDTTMKGYTCFDNTLINGDTISTIPAVTSKDQCARLCEASSETCSMAVWNAATQTCQLEDNVFAFGGSGARAPGITSCLRSASGGTKNSPPNFLCYAAQSVSGTVLKTTAGVADATVCANQCAATPGCTMVTYNPVLAATCTLKSNPFYGTENPSITSNNFDVSSCFLAPGAPEVLSSFGVPDSSPGTVSGDFR